MLDANISHQMKELLGDAYDTFMQEYVLVSKEMSEKMEGHFQAGEMDDVRRLAHSIKSSSAQVGALGVAEVAKDIELYEGTIESDLIQELQSQLAAVRVALKV